LKIFSEAEYILFFVQIKISRIYHLHLLAYLRMLYRQDWWRSWQDWWRNGRIAGLVAQSVK